MQAHRVETVLQQDGTLTLDNLPFQAGESVEVIILAQPIVSTRENPYPLRGTAIRYDLPTEPVAQDQWDATQ